MIIFFNLKIKKEIRILMKNKRTNLFVKSDKNKAMCDSENNINSISYFTYLESYTNDHVVQLEECILY